MAVTVRGWVIRRLDKRGFKKNKIKKPQRRKTCPPVQITMASMWDDPVCSSLGCSFTSVFDAWNYWPLSFFYSVKFRGLFNFEYNPWTTLSQFEPDESSSANMSCHQGRWLFVPDFIYFGHTALLNLDLITEATPHHDTASSSCTAAAILLLRHVCLVIIMVIFGLSKTSW